MTWYQRFSRVSTKGQLLVYIAVGTLSTALYRVGTWMESQYSLWESPSQILYSIPRSLLLEPLSFLQGTLVTYAALWIFRKVQRAATTDGETSDACIMDPEAVATAARAVLKSTAFLTTLRDALPDDNDSDLSQVPFILKTINERREHAALEVRRFFWLTLGVGGVFSCVVLYYGYALVNESAVGFPARIADLSRETRSLRDVETRLSVSGHRSWDDELLKTVRGLVKVNVPRELEAPWSEIKDDLVRISTGNAPPSVFLGLSRSLETQSTNGKAQELAASSNKDLSEGYTKTAVLLSSIAEEIRSEQAARELATKRIDALVAEAEKVREVPSNQIGELVKRVSVGFVVTTFLLAIMRYIAGLYREARTTVARLVEQEILVRRFCVALRSTKSNEARDRVSSAFAGNSADSTCPSADVALAEGAERTATMLQELRTVLEKKAT